MYPSFLKDFITVVGPPEAYMAKFFQAGLAKKLYRPADSTQNKANKESHKD